MILNQSLQQKHLGLFSRRKLMHFEASDLNEFSKHPYKLNI